MTFSEAFAKARKEQGPGGVFTYKGKKYSTNRADDKAKTAKNNVEKKIDVTPVKKPKTETKKEKEVKEVKQEKKFIEGEEDKSLLSFIPSNLRMFFDDTVRTQLGLEKEGLTEKDLSETQLDDLRQTVLNSIDRMGVDDGILDGIIDYEDYNTELGNAYKGGVSKFLNPAFHNKTTFGKMNYDVDDDGNVILTDSFDFADAAAKQDDSIFKKFARIGEAYSKSDSFGEGIYRALRETSGNFGSPEGEGGQSTINLGNFLTEDQLAGIMATEAAKDIV
tara:strand:- start:216 stop:1046 length:831 start_codon:yes stop_codon:yes gene_type:complete